MDILGTLQKVTATLKSLFAEKGELKGFDDWDAFIGCIIVLEQMINSFSELANQAEDGDEVNGG